MHVRMPRTPSRAVALNDLVIRQLIRTQQNEMTEYVIYSNLSRRVSGEHNRKILRQIAEDERRHAAFWQTYTGARPAPNHIMVWLYLVIARIAGFTFTVKLMERGEEKAQVNYRDLARIIPEATNIEKEESRHESELLGMLDEVRLRYVGSMVLGLNDALVELTGALAGFTFALRDPKLIGATGLITGIAASLSMAASEYLSTSSESEGKDPRRAALYTGIMYGCTVVVLILPYLLLQNVYLALAATLTSAVGIILLFTFYTSVAQELPFLSRFFQMAGISFGVSVLTFLVGLIVRTVFGLDV